MLSVFHRFAQTQPRQTLPRAAPGGSHSHILLPLANWDARACDAILIHQTPLANVFIVSMISERSPNEVQWPQLKKFQYSSAVDRPSYWVMPILRSVCSKATLRRLRNLLTVCKLDYTYCEEQTPFQLGMVEAFQRVFLI